MKNVKPSYCFFFCLLFIFNVAFILVGAESVINNNNSQKNVYDPYNLETAMQFEDTVPVAIMGTGPGGLSSSLWTSRAKFKTLTFAGPKPLGQLPEISTIENWPGRPKTSGLKAIDELKEQAEHFGTQIVYDTVTTVDLSSWPYTLATEKGSTIHCLSLIIATGGTPKKKDVPGVKKYWGKGVGTCSICDAPFAKDKKVVIIGGGDTAGDRALQFAAYAKKVTLIVREPALEACATVQEYLHENAKIDFLYNTELLEIIGDGKKVTAIRIENTQTGEKKKIDVDGVYFAIGFTPNSDVFKKILEIDEKGFIVRKDCSQKTSVEGVFVAGDVDNNPHRKAAVAVGNGVEAALEAIDFLQAHGFTPDSTKQLKYPSIIAPEEVDIQTISKVSELKKILASEEKPILVDFYADYCALCRSLMPELNLLAKDYEEKLRIIKVERNKESMGLFDYFGISSVPYYVIFKNSRERGRAAGVSTPSDLRNFIEKYFNVSASDKTTVNEKIPKNS